MCRCIEGWLGLALLFSVMWIDVKIVEFIFTLF